MSVEWPILKHFKQGDRVKFDLDEDKYCYQSYGKDCIMEVMGYDDAGWCRIKYVENVNGNNIGKENGHPDRILKMYKPKTYLDEGLFEL